MKLFTSVLAILAVLAEPAICARGDTELVALKDGTVFLGEVVELSATEVTVEVAFPDPGRRTLRREELTDAALWRILSNRLAAEDGKGRLDLGRWAEERGLLAAALTEYRRAARASDEREEAGKRAAALEGRIAKELFEQGEEYLAQDRPASARGYFELILKRYGAAPSATAARERLREIEARIADQKTARAQAADAAAKSRDRAVWDASAKRLADHLREADRFEQEVVHGARPVKEAAAVRRRIEHLEAAWKIANEIGAPPEGTEKPEFEDPRATVKARLVKAHLDLGFLYLVRRALNQAAEHCTTACDLDPENAASHSLHAKIIDAWIATGWGWPTGHAGPPGR